MYVVVSCSFVNAVGFCLQGGLLTITDNVNAFAHKEREIK